MFTEHCSVSTILVYYPRLFSPNRMKGFPWKNHHNITKQLIWFFLSCSNGSRWVNTQQYCSTAVDGSTNNKQVKLVQLSHIKSNVQWFESRNDLNFQNQCPRDTNLKFNVWSDDCNTQWIGCVHNIKIDFFLRQSRKIWLPAPALHFKWTLGSTMKKYRCSFVHMYSAMYLNSIVRQIVQSR